MKLPQCVIDLDTKTMWYANFRFNGIARGIKAIFFFLDRLQPRNKEARLAYVTQALYRNISVKQVLGFFFFHLTLTIWQKKEKKSLEEVALPFLFSAERMSQTILTMLIKMKQQGTRRC